MAVSFLKKGKEARKEAALVDADRKRRQEDQTRRFWVKRGGERRITFLDGSLDADGELSMVTYYEHNLYMNGNWRNFFVCTGNEEEPCPICEEGKLPSMVAAFTIVDHTEYTDRNGETHKNQKMLLIAKRQTQQILETIAVKRGGLAGLTFDVMRVDEDQSPAVGTMFDFVKKHELAKVLKAYGEPYEYEKVLGYKPPEELRAMGFGKAGGSKVGGESIDDPDDGDGLGGDDPGIDDLDDEL